MQSTQRPANSRPLSPLTGDSSVGAVIAGFLAESEGGADRELRAALSHVDAELGTMPVANIRPRHVTALLDDLRRAGLSPRRRAAVTGALNAVFAFALAHRLVAVNPMGGAAHEPSQNRPDPTGGQAHAPPQDGPTPTFVMLALGARVAFWTTWLIAVGFLALLLILLVELG